VLHEVFSDSFVDSGAAFGFALGQARSLVLPSRPGLLFLQLGSDAQETGLPYGLGLKIFGLGLDALVLVRTDTIVELLWAIEEAVACRAVAAIVADIAYSHREVDFTASRRLALRTAAGGASVFLVRHGRGREASAARFRWKVSGLPSRPPPYDNHAPGPPRWRVVLEKGRLGNRRGTAPDGEVYRVDWTDDGFVLANDSRDDSRDDSSETAGPQRPAALPHAASAALGDRLSEAG
jgi:protein ImuA